MKITSVTVKKNEREDSNVKAIATLILDDCFKIRDIRIKEGTKGLFVSMPNKKLKTGEHIDIAHPTNQETRDMFESVILEAYKNAE